MKTDFREATLVDINAIFAIDTVATDERYNDIKQWVKQNICFVLETNSEILAYGVLHHHFFSYGFIELLMVNINHRKQGIGLTLINALKKQSKTGKIFTSTNQSNHATQRLFEKAGFILSGHIDNLDEDDPELIYCYKPD